MNETFHFWRRSGFTGWMGCGAMLAVGMTLAGATLSPAAPVYYQNPVIPGDHPDPSIIRVGNDFWATCTSSEWGPQFPLLHSTDLVNWELTGPVFPHRPDWAVGNFWAPEISEYKGRFAVYYVARERGGPLAVAVATADKPGGPYVDHGPMVAQPDGSIDPAPATDENGVRYLIWKEDGNSRGQPTIIWAQRLNDDGTRLIDEPHELIRNDSDWEGAVVEGPFILRHNDWFYLFYSGNGCCGPGCNYALGVARSRKLLGPWEKNQMNPILFANESWKCPGHGSIVTDQQGRYWLLYHAYSTGGSVFLGREGLLDEVKFGTNDWPTINDSKGPSVKAVSPFGAVQQKTDDRFFDNFTGTELEKGWQWPQSHEPSCQVKNGQLWLSANERGNNMLGAVLARPTLAADYVAATIVETKPLKSGWSAGLCAFGDSQNAMGVVFRDGNIITWRRDKGETHQLAQQAAPAGKKLFLRLTAHQGYHFQFAFSADGKKWASCGDVSDAKNLPPWDRSVRVALTVGGAADAVGQFDSFSLAPLDASHKD
ncbi:MAG TPA: family 43 glycosylhydrolase [Candidatus Binatia bacterium]|nr:family 43 glycosylhydrolase [Candidatus Binatia bacterium]